MSLIRRVRPKKTGVRAPLGDLEQEVMRHVWACGATGCLGAELQEALESHHAVALSTVLTTLERLRDKGILTREREGKAYRYWALLSEEELQRRIVEGVLGDLISQFPQAVAAYFSQQGLTDASKTDEKITLDELARRLEAMTRQESEKDHGD